MEYLFIYLFIFLLIYLFIYLLIYLFIYLFIYFRSIETSANTLILENILFSCLVIYNV